MAPPPYTFMTQLSFQFRVTFIKPRATAPHETYTTGAWKPPTLAEHVETVLQPSWMRWNVGSLTPLADRDVNWNSAPTIATMWWSADSQRFLFCPFNCLYQNVRDHEMAYGEAGGWQNLRFSHPYENSNLSVLDFNGISPYLAAQGSPSWVPEVLPTTYNPPSGATRAPGNAELAGKFCLLIALMIMSAPAGQPFEPLKRNFRPPHWLPHQSRKPSK